MEKIAHFKRFVQQYGTTLPPQFYQHYALEKKTHSDLVRIYEKICTMRVKHTTNRRWLENQLYLFIWITLKHSQIWERPESEFTDIQWQDISKYFTNKSPSECKYFMIQARKKSSFDQFQKEEDNLLKEIVGKYKGRIKWSQIGLQLYLLSRQKYTKKAKQYRERYLNFLDQRVKRAKWTNEEQLQLIRLVLELGKKWSKIGKILNRTENTVKNHYNSLFFKSTKGKTNKRYKKKFFNIEQEIQVIQKYISKVVTQEKIDPMTSPCIEFKEIEVEKLNKDKQIDLKSPFSAFTGFSPFTPCLMSISSSNIYNSSLTQLLMNEMTYHSFCP